MSAPILDIIWKPVKDFESYYLISNSGIVKSLPRQWICGANGKTEFNKSETILKSNIVANYLHVCFSVDAKATNQYIHHLVAHHFVPNPNNYPEINHDDGNKLNNWYWNLEWTTRSGNNLHAWKTGLNKGYDKSGTNNPKYRNGSRVLVNELKNCEWCNKEFVAKYITSRFCSHSCVVHSNLKQINEKRRYTL